MSTINAIETATHTLNFLLTGPVRGGSAVLQSALNTDLRIACHRNLLYCGMSELREKLNINLADTIRRECHESYFGVPVFNPKARAEDSPAWCKIFDVSPVHYLSSVVFDHPVKGESAVGVRLSYVDLTLLDLYEFIDERCREGDFCVINVQRNPVACFVSLKQAEQSKCWQRSIGETGSRHCPLPLSIDLDELIAFVRHHESVAGKLRSVCPDRLDVNYRDLLLNYRQALCGVYAFLEMSQTSITIPYPLCSRLPNYGIRERIVNWNSIRVRAPKTIRNYFDAEDLI